MSAIKGISRFRKIAGVALVLSLGGTALWFLVFKPDGPPPEHMVDLLAASADVIEARRLVEDHFKATQGLVGADKLVLPSLSTNSETLKSLVVKADGSVVAKIAVRANASDKNEGDHVLVTLVWTPLVSLRANSIQWKCAGTPDDYVPQLCR